MSRFARLIAPVTAIATKASVAGTLPIGTAIKCVNVTDNGYLFSALWFGEWTTMQTTADLPAATDRGSATRRSTLQPGRPAASSEPATVRLVCKVTREQYGSVFRLADALGLTVPRYLRQLLLDSGMPE